MATQQEQRPQRPRTGSMLSFGARSHKSSGSVTKADLADVPKDRITGKADPRVAMNELQPSARVHDESTMSPLRSMQHRDSFGNVINDPDRSNPTRPRMERPLDTIRSFEAAIEGGYNRRFSAQPDMQSRRSSYHQGNVPRTPVSAGGYFDRQSHSRPDSMYGDVNERGYFQHDRGYTQDRTPGTDRGFHNGGGHSGYNQERRRYPPRNQSEPAMYGNTNFGTNGASPITPHNPAGPVQWTHPALAHGQHDNMTTSTSGSYGTDQGTNSTGESLHNSSYGELPQQQFKPQVPPHDAYAQGYGQGSEMMEDEYGQPLRMQKNRGMPQQNVDMGPPPPPAHGRGITGGGNTLRKALPQNSGPPVPQHGVQNGATSTSSRPPAEKRKSWLARRFSKNS